MSDSEKKRALAKARQERLRAKRLALGYKRKEIYCTDDEYKVLVAMLESMRDKT